MNEQNTIPAEMLDAAAGVVTDSAAGFYLTDNGCKEVAQAVLEATDVPALQERIASAEQIIASRQSELNAARARIAELEAALRNRICEGCDKLMANVGQSHLCGCEDQRNLCGACKAECACAGGE